LEAELKERDRQLQTDLRIASLTVALVYREGAKHSKPHEAATRVLGGHPDDVWPTIVANIRAKSAQEFDAWYEDTGMQKTQGLDIPDYDPTCGRPALVRPGRL